MTHDPMSWSPVHISAEYRAQLAATPRLALDGKDFVQRAFAATAGVCGGMSLSVWAERELNALITINNDTAAQLRDWLVEALPEMQRRQEAWDYAYAVSLNPPLAPEVVERPECAAGTCPDCAEIAYDAAREALYDMESGK